MSAPAVLDQPSLLQTWRGVRGAVVTLAIGLLVLGLAFRQEVLAAVAVWSSSTAYNHCFLVLPIAAYLVWDRRMTLRGFTAEPLPLASLLMLPLVVLWLAAERLGIMEGRQLIAMTMVQVLFVSVLGWRLWWALSGPLLYLYFLVPFGAFITPRLQNFTTDFVQVGLNVLHVPVYINGFTIDIPEGSFYVAEACAGLRFLIASIAFGALYSLVMYRSPVRRGVFMLASLVVPVIANGFRALGIVMLGHLLGSAQAAATDHVLYGWLFFSLVILLLIALGLPFREDNREPAIPAVHRPLRPVDPAMSRRAITATILGCLLALLGPGVTLAVAGTGSVTAAAAPVVTPGSCSRQPGSEPAPFAELRSSSRGFTCNGLPVQVQTVVLSPHATAAPVFAIERGMIDKGGEEGVTVHWIAPRAGQVPTWRLVESPDLSFIAAVSLWVDGKPTQPSLPVRLHLAMTSLPGARLAPVVVTVTPSAKLAELGLEQRRQLADRLVHMVQGWSGLTPQIQQIAAGAGTLH